MYPIRPPAYIKCSHCNHCKWVFHTEDVALTFGMFMAHMLRDHKEYVKASYKEATGEDL